MKKPEIIILVGNIGSGKTTYARQIIEEQRFSYVVIARDALRYMIGAGKYRYDTSIEKAIFATERDCVINFMKLRQNILIDEIGMSKKLRKRYIDLAKRHKYFVTVIEMPKLSKKTCVDRRMKDPHDTLNRGLWCSVWDKFNALYESPSLTEGIDKIIKL
jgi:predicted kinase